MTWIEQVNTKRHAVGASNAIAVSSRAFSKRARLAATKYNIEVRMLSRISDSDISRWAGMLQVTQREICYSECQVSVTCEGSDPMPVEVKGWLQDLVQTDSLDCHFISVPSSPHLLSPLDLVRQRYVRDMGIPKGAAVTVTIPPKSGVSIGIDPALQLVLGADPPADGSLAAREFTLDFNDGEAFLRWQEVSRSIKRVTLYFNVRLVSDIPIDSQTYRYHSANGLLAEVAERQTSLASGETVLMTEHRRDSQPTEPPVAAGSEDRRE